MYSVLMTIFQIVKQIIAYMYTVLILDTFKTFIVSCPVSFFFIRENMVILGKETNSKLFRFTIIEHRIAQTTQRHQHPN